MEKNLYEILGVNKKSTDKEIKQAYRKLMFKYHPDKGDPSLEDKCKEINDAYDILGDSTKRKQYDQQCNNPLFGMMSGAMPGAMPGAMHGEMPIPPELFELFTGGLFGGEMPQVFHMSTGGPINMGHGNTMNMHPSMGSMGGGIQQPEPIQKKLEISLEEAYSGKTKQISVSRTIMSGGSRRLENETLYISVPSGVDTDEIITIKNKGNIINNVRGDVKVVITVKNFTKFNRQGIDLVYNKDISLREALCGFNFDMEYIDGRMFKIKNDSGNIISSGYNKIIQKMGMVRGKIKGDLIIKFNVIFPDKLTETQINSIKEIL